MPIPGGRDPFGGGLQAIDDRRGTFLLGETERTGPVQGVRGGYCGEIFGGAQDETT